MVRKNAWSIGTFKKMATLKEDLVSFKKNVSFSDLDEKGLTAFVHYLREKKVLNSPRKKKGDRDEYDDEDVMGLRNSTIQKKLGFLKAVIIVTPSCLTILLVCIQKKRQACFQMLHHNLRLINMKTYTPI